MAHITTYYYYLEVSRSTAVSRVVAKDAMFADPKRSLNRIRSTK